MGTRGGENRFLRRLVGWLLRQLPSVSAPEVGTGRSPQISQQLLWLHQQEPLDLLGVSSTSDPESIKAIFAGASGNIFAVSPQALRTYETVLLRPYLTTRGASPLVKHGEIPNEVKNLLTLVDEALDCCSVRFYALQTGESGVDLRHPSNRKSAKEIAQNAIRKAARSSATALKPANPRRSDPSSPV